MLLQGDKKLTRGLGILRLGRDTDASWLPGIFPIFLYLRSRRELEGTGAFPMSYRCSERGKPRQ